MAVEQPEALEVGAEAERRAGNDQSDSLRRELVGDVSENLGRGRVGAGNGGGIEDHRPHRRVGFLEADAEAARWRWCGVREEELASEPHDHEAGKGRVVGMPLDVPEADVLVGDAFRGPSEDASPRAWVELRDQRDERCGNGGRDPAERSEREHAEEAR